MEAQKFFKKSESFVAAAFCSSFFITAAFLCITYAFSKNTEEGLKSPASKFALTALMFIVGLFIMYYCIKEVLKDDNDKVHGQYKYLADDRRNIIINLNNENMGLQLQNISNTLELICLEIINMLKDDQTIGTKIQGLQTLQGLQSTLDETLSSVREAKKKNKEDRLLVLNSNAHTISAHFKSIVGLLNPSNKISDVNLQQNPLGVGVS